MKYRIIYGCPASNTPTGGIKVIYRHAALLKEMYGNSYVWHVNEPEFCCSWFQHSAETISTDKLSPTTDFIVVPEIWAGGYVNLLKKMGFKVGIFVQNAYMTHINLEPNMPDALIESYKNADLILAISEDSAQYIKDIFGILEEKIIPQRCSVDSMLFKPNKKNKIITYMPRKMGAHSIRVVSALQPLLRNDWSIISIDNVMESQVAAILSQSSIFLSFSEFEGLGLPPIEAALCGNLVVGYHGQGGKDFWHEPIFHNVDQGDIRKFVSTTLREVNKMEKEKSSLNFMSNERVKLAEKFSQNQEINHLVELDSRVRDLFSHVEND